MLRGAGLMLIGLMWSAVACASNPSPAALDVTPIMAATSPRSPMPPSPVDAISAPTLRPVTTSTPRLIGSSSAPPIEVSPTTTLFTCPPMPTPTVLETQAAVQHFEHGLMFWLEARNEIWALIDSPLEKQFYWRILPNLWAESMPEVPADGLTPPAGRYVPMRGFGQAWIAPLLRDDLGWAVDKEAGFTTMLTYYPQGFYTPDCTWEPKSGVYELKDDRGQAFQFVGAGGIAKRMDNEQ